MPQMSPLMWLSLFIMFCTVFMLFNMMNYYMFNTKNKYLYQFTLNKMDKQNKNTLNWKW